MSKDKIYMNAEDGLKMLIVPTLMSTFLPYLSTEYESPERLAKIEALSSNAIVINKLLELAVDNKEAADAGDNPLVDYLYAESTYLVTRFKHLLPKATLKEVKKLEKDLAKFTELRMKEEIKKAKGEANGTSK